MRRGINKVTLVGHVGEAPKVNQINDDVKVARFPLATNEFYIDREGNEVQKTEWHTVVTWGRLAENCAEYLFKGRQVWVEGRLRTRSWEDREGNTRKATEVVAQTVKFLDGRGDARPQAAPPADAAQAKPDIPWVGPGDDEDLPF